MKDLEKIAIFINKHHVMCLATSYENELSVCSLFYVYDDESRCFVVASSEKTQHINHIQKNNTIAGNIVLETDVVSKIEGLQFRGECIQLQDTALKKLYFKKFPYALAMMPTLWEIKVNFFKLTDNTLGFGKKLIWQEFSAQT